MIRANNTDNQGKQRQLIRVKQQQVIKADKYQHRHNQVLQYCTRNLVGLLS